jgi:hypothetical protein
MPYHFLESEKFRKKSSLCQGHKIYNDKLLRENNFLASRYILCQHHAKS